MDGRLRCMRTVEKKIYNKKKKEASHILKYVGGAGGCCCCGAVTLDPHERVLIFIKI
jgi:hypothetical protein